MYSRKTLLMIILTLINSELYYNYVYTITELYSNNIDTLLIPMNRILLTRAWQTVESVVGLRPVVICSGRARVLEGRRGTLKAVGTWNKTTQGSVISTMQSGNAFNFFFLIFYLEKMFPVEPNISKRVDEMSYINDTPWEFKKMFRNSSKTI